MGIERFLKKNLSSLALAAVLGAALSASSGGIPEGAASYDGHVSGVANAPGFEGSDWHTDLFLHHHGIAGDAPITVRLHYAGRGDSPQDDEYVVVVLQPGRTESIRDVVSTLFHQEGVGVIEYEILGDEAKITVNANTYNRVGEHEQYGQQIFGRPWSAATPAGTALVVPGPVDFASYRANIGFTAAPNTTEARIVARNKSGNLLREEILPVAPGSWNQIIKIVENWAPGQLPGVYFEIVGMTGPIDGALSIVNNPTGDGANVQGRSVDDSEEAQWLTGAAYLTGNNSSNWRSDIQLVNPTGFSGGSSFVYFPRGSNNGGELDFIAFSLDSRQGKAIENILANEFLLPNGSAGAFQTFSNPDAQNVSFMQTLNQIGIDAQGRTIAYGQNVPAVNHGAAAVGDLEGVLTGIDHNDDFRANLLLQNTLYDTFTGQFKELTVDVELHTAEGDLAGVKS